MYNCECKFPEIMSSRRSKVQNFNCLTFPITAQTLVSLKNEIKNNSDRASSYFDSLLATGLENQTDNKQQSNYIHQLLIACIYSISDSAKCNKAITRCLSLSLFKESYNFSLFQYNLLHGMLSTSSAKYPNIEQFQILASVDKRCKENPSTVSIYLVNLLRIFIGLKMHSKYKLGDFLEAKNGLLFWIDRLRMKDKQLYAALCDHVFRLLYSASFSDDHHNCGMH